MAVTIEAPPPYCPVDPSKVRSTDHMPHYSHISPVEIIDLNTNSHHNTEQVKCMVERRSHSFDDCPFVVTTQSQSSSHCGMALVGLGYGRWHRLYIPHGIVSGLAASVHEGLFDGVLVLSRSFSIGSVFSPSCASYRRLQPVSVQCPVLALA